MSDNWGPGDQAFCIDDGPSAWHEPNEKLTFGRPYTVVGFHKGWPNDILQLAEFPRQIFRHFDAKRFKKLPPHTLDEFDREIIDAMSGKSKKTKVKENA